MPTTPKYVIVQHSGFGYSQKPGFEQGLEVRAVDKVADQRKITKIGGLLFDSHREADDYTFDEKIVGPGMYPNAKGTFADLTIDDLKVYIPPNETDDAIQLAVSTVKHAVEHWGADATVIGPDVVEFKRIINGTERTVRLAVSIAN